MVGLHQAGVADDAVAVRIGVIAEAQVELVFDRKQLLHRIGRRAIHANLAVPVERHETEGGIDLGIHNGRVDLVAFDDRLPVMHGGAAEWVNTDLETRRADRVHVDDIDKIGDVGCDVIVARDAPR